MLMIESPTKAVRLSCSRFDPTASRRLSFSGSLFVPWNKFQRVADCFYSKRKSLSRNRIRASAEEQSSPIKQNAKPSRYHPFEDIAEQELVEGGEARLTPAETTRTIIEVNSKATLVFSGFVNDEALENIFWPDLPYVTDEYGNIYFQVKNDEDILQTLTAEDNLVQVIIGLDTAGLLGEMDLASSEIDSGFEEIDGEDSDTDSDADEDEDEDEDDEEEEEDYDEDWVSVLEDGENQEDSDESPGDWAKLETMRSSHPLYFAKKLSENTSEAAIDYMDQPPTGLGIQGLLRPAFVEEHAVIQKHILDSNHKSGNADLNQVRRDEEDQVEGLGVINGHRHRAGSSEENSIWAEELEKGETLGSETSFYKLEMVKIQLVSAHGNQTVVEVDDFRKAQPDAIAHSAAKIISRLKDGGDKTAKALKSLCWRCRGIQVEEATLAGLDTLGFDLRICSGTQLQTLRFAFNSRVWTPTLKKRKEAKLRAPRLIHLNFKLDLELQQASSEYGAERQLNDLLFPRSPHHKLVKKKARQTEW